MKNEETTIMQPNNEQGHETQNPSATSETQKKSNTGQRVAATAGAAVIGGAAGAGGTIATEHMMNGKEEPETKEPETKEEPTASASKTNEGTHTQAKHETVAKEEPESVPEDGTQDGPDYPGLNGANPTTPNPGIHQTNDPSNGNETAHVRVVDIQNVQGPNGENAEFVTLTDGQDVAVVADLDGDGKADKIGIDDSHNGHFEQNEIHDISDENWDMAGYRQSYAQQNGGTHQEPQTQTHTTNDNDSNDVQVLGVYQTEGESGQTVETAVLTNGQEVAAVVDVDGDRYAEALWVDENRNQQIDEGEVYDVSGKQVHMSGYEQQYLAQQQQQQEQQQQDTFAYNAGDDQSDYINDVDPQNT